MAPGRKEVHQDAPTQTPQRSRGGLFRRIRAPCKTSVGESGRKGGYTNKGNTKRHYAKQGHPPDKRPALAHPRWGSTISPTVRSRLPQRVRANKGRPKERGRRPRRPRTNPAKSRQFRAAKKRHPRLLKTTKKSQPTPRQDITQLSLAPHIGLWLRIATG